MEKETKKRKGGAERERERKKKKLKEIAAKCMNIQQAFARASASTESQTTVNPALLLEDRDQHQSVSYHNKPASDLVNQNCSDISIPPVSESEVQTVHTDEPEPDSLSEDNLEVCSPPLMQVLESQCLQSVNLDPAISDSEDYSALSAQVSEVQRDQSLIPPATNPPWLVKPKRYKLTEYFEFHPHQPETPNLSLQMCTFNLMTLEVVCSDYGSRIVKKKKLYFAIFALHMVLLLVANRTPANF